MATRTDFAKAQDGAFSTLMLDAEMHQAYNDSKNGVIMMKTSVQVSFRMDEDVKRQAETIFDELGMNMTTAFNVFAKAVIRTGGMPFKMKVDSFYNAENQRELARRIELYESGATKGQQIEITPEELESYANG